MSHPTQSSPGSPARVLIAGGGVAGLEAAFALRELVGDRAAVRVLAPGEEFVYRPMAVGEPFTAGRAQHLPLAKLTEAAGAELVRGTLAAVDADARTVSTAEGDVHAYDFLIVCPGALMRQPYDHATPFDDARADELLHGLVQDIEEGYVRRLAVVIPAPLAWPLPGYEVALMAAERAWDMGAEMDTIVVTPETSPLAVFGAKASHDLLRLLAERGIEVVTSAYCEIPEAQTIVVHPGGRVVHAERIVSLPTLSGPGVAGLPQDGNGFIPIDEHGRVVGVDRVWAAGDATDFPLKFGGVAAQLADTVAAGIAEATGAAVTPEPFHPVLEATLLTGGRPRRLQGPGQRDDEEASGMTEAPATRRPAKIAARYLAPYLAATGATVGS